MLLILSAALLPLGLIAVLASLQSAQQNSAERREETLGRLEIKAQRINAALSRAAITIDTGAAAIASPPIPDLRNHAGAPRAGPCRARYALYGGGSQPSCASAGITLPDSSQRRSGAASIAELLPDGSRRSIEPLRRGRRSAGRRRIPEGDAFGTLLHPGDKPQLRP
jgi:hypothetical protein